MNKYWHSEKDDGNNTEYYNEAFWNHEYSKHGYCYTQFMERMILSFSKML